MTTLQKVIKALAIAFAIFLIVNICFGILSIFGLTSKINNISTSSKRVDVQKDFSDINLDFIDSIEISSTVSNLKIVNGDTLRVEADNVDEDIILKQENNKLVVKENAKNNLFNQNKVSEIRIYIPNNLSLKQFKLDSGVGETYIENVNTDDLVLNLGVGNIVIDNILAKKSKIDSGVGNIQINNGDMGVADFDLGVGSTKIKAILDDRSKVDCGVGEVEIYLIKSLDSYKLDIEKGLGNIQVNDEKISGDTIIGDGLNKIEIEAGMGNINITVEK